MVDLDTLSATSSAMSGANEHFKSFFALGEGEEDMKGE